MASAQETVLRLIELTAEENADLRMRAEAALEACRLIQKAGLLVVRPDELRGIVITEGPARPVAVTPTRKAQAQRAASVQKTRPGFQAAAVEAVGRAAENVIAQALRDVIAGRRR